MSRAAPLLRIRNARQHNLRGVDIDIPRDQLVVITGPSGSGKSSLAFDTIYAEGRRRYVESLSVHARHLLGQLDKPEVDSIEGLSPAISVQQHAGSRNPRSTVGTITELYDYLRLLFARVGVPHSPATGEPMQAFTAQQIVDRVLRLPEGTRLTVRAPVAHQPGDEQGLMRKLLAEGFARVSVDGTVHDLTDSITIKPESVVELVVDRIKVRGGARSRLAEAVELSLSRSGGVVRIVGEDGFDWLASDSLMCPGSGERYPRLTPRTFSFNSPDSACPDCSGLGTVLHFDEQRVVPDTSLSLQEGAIAAWGKPDGAFYTDQLSSLQTAMKVSADKPWSRLTAAQRKRVLHGSSKWEGVLVGLQRRREQYAQKRQSALRSAGSGRLQDTLSQLEEDLLGYTSETDCPACGGSRLGPLGRGVTVGERRIAELVRMPLSELLDYVRALTLEGAQQEIAERILRDVRSRLGFLVDLGLDYLSLDRSFRSLSGGEAERVRLATQIGAGLVGVLYVLDEPSAGLHPRDSERLVQSLKRLRDLGNSVLLVEHDLDTVRAADYVIDLGPGAGSHGGEVVATGTVQQVSDNPDSPTGRYLAGAVPSAGPRHSQPPTQFLSLSGACTHNLRGDEARFALGALTCVTGVSGSGKSSLVVDTLLPLMRARLNASSPPVAGELSGGEHLQRVLEVDQAPIGRSPRSNPASYVGALAELRTLFAGLPEARARGYNAARFSFNVKGGRCEACQGDGVVRVEMHFLPDAFVVCDVCKGERYNRETLEVRYRGYSFADVLAMDVDRAAELFAAIPKLARKLQGLREVGLGYLSLGQRAPSLSGGEAQRVKLARELGRRAIGDSLIVLDEPTAGLHMSDVALLVELLHALVDAGNTVVVIEHHLSVVRAADHVIDMGPQGGPAGGQVLFQGPVSELAAHPESHTARFLR